MLFSENYSQSQSPSPSCQDLKVYRCEDPMKEGYAGHIPYFMCCRPSGIGNREYVIERGCYAIDKSKCVKKIDRCNLMFRAMKLSKRTESANSIHSEPKSEPKEDSDFQNRVVKHTQFVAGTGNNWRGSGRTAGDGFNKKKLKTNLTDIPDAKKMKQNAAKRDARRQSLKPEKSDDSTKKKAKKYDVKYGEGGDAKGKEKEVSKGGDAKKSKVPAGEEKEAGKEKEANKGKKVEKGKSKVKGQSGGTEKKKTEKSKAKKKSSLEEKSKEKKQEKTKSKAAKSKSATKKKSSEEKK